MNRIHEIMAAKDLGAAGTEVIEITADKPISGILLNWDYTVATVSVMTARIVDCISKIELVDGSKVLESASGADFQAAYAETQKKLPYERINLTVGGHCITQIPILFGRYLGDPNYAINPNNYNNLALRITYDEDVANGSVTVNEFSAYAVLLQDSVAGGISGYFSLKNQRIDPMAASSHLYAYLNSDNPYAGLLIRGLSDDHDLKDLLTNFSLDINAGSLRPFDNYPFDELIRQIVSERGRFISAHTLDAAVTAKTIYSMVSENGDIKIAYDGTVFVTTTSKFAVPTWTGAKLALAASVDIKALTALISGELVHQSVYIPFGNDNLVESFYTPAASDKIKLDILTSSDADSGDTLYIAGRQLVRE